MKRMAIGLAMVTVAAAQDVPILTKLFTTTSTAVMGSVVKGAPYAADEVTESLQVLGDGTRISNQGQVTVYRDGEGRVRRENGKEITIWDPVENVSYTLHSETKTATKSAMGMAPRRTTGATQQFYFTTDSGTTTVAAPGVKTAADPQTVALALQKLQAELAMQAATVNGSTADQQTLAALKEQLAVAMKKAAVMPDDPQTAAMIDKKKAELAATQKALKARVTSDAAMQEQTGTFLFKTEKPAALKTEALGQQVMEGLPVQGTRTTSVIEAGTIGNDRPINVLSESWYSSDLQTVVMSKHSDPRSGEETFRLTNVRRGEPGMDLFMVPPGYTLNDTFAPRAVPVKKEQ